MNGLQVNNNLQLEIVHASKLYISNISSTPTICSHMCLDITSLGIRQRPVYAKIRLLFEIIEALQNWIVFEQERGNS